MTTEQQAREALEVLWNDTDPTAITLAHETLQSFITQAAADKRIADAVRGAEVVAYASETACPPMQKKQRDRMIEDGQHGGEFAIAARTAATFTIPLIALPADAVGGGE